jgi:hypothetical protein
MHAMAVLFGLFSNRIGSRKSSLVWQKKLQITPVCPIFLFKIIYCIIQYKGQVVSEYTTSCVHLDL